MKLPYFNLLLFNEDVPATDSVDTNTEQPTEQPQSQPEWLGEIKGQFDKQEFSPSSVDELKELIEMGKFYKEKGKAKLDSYKNEQAKIDFINEALKEQGYEDFNKWKADVDEAKKQTAIEKIAQEKSLSVEDARDFYEGQTAREQVKALTAKEEETKAQIRAREKQITDFFQKHSDLKTEDLPKEVLEAFEKGASLEVAYLEHQLMQNNKQIKEIKKIQENGLMPGSAAGVQQGGKMDINKMSPEEFKAYKRKQFAQK